MSIRNLPDFVSLDVLRWGHPSTIQFPTEYDNDRVNTYFYKHALTLSVSFKVAG